MNLSKRASDIIEELKFNGIDVSKYSIQSSTGLLAMTFLNTEDCEKTMDHIVSIDPEIFVICANDFSSIHLILE